MSTQFPSSIISFSTKVNGQVIDANDVNSPQAEITALETKVGADSSADTTSLDYKISNALSDGGGHVQTANKGGTGQTSYTKGDLLVASSSSVLGKLSVGNDGLSLVADSSQTTGVNWGASADIVYSVGAVGSGVVKTYFNMQLPFTLWIGSVLGDLTTSFINWVRNSTDIGVAPMGTMIDVTGTGADSIYCDFWKSLLQFNATNTVIADFWVKLPATATGDLNLGFHNDDAANALQSVYDSTLYDKICFTQLGSDCSVRPTIVKAGTGVTHGTAITTATLGTTWHNFRIVATLGASGSAKFYIDGVLKDTLSGTNFPTATTKVYLGFGRSNTNLFRVTAPNLALQMNP